MGQILPLGAKFAPRREVHSLGPGVKLRMALWDHFRESDQLEMRVSNECILIVGTPIFFLFFSFLFDFFC
jgi:hypothetical protein